MLKPEIATALGSEQQAKRRQVPQAFQRYSDNHQLIMYFRSSGSSSLAHSASNEQPSIIVAYQDVTAESSSLANHPDDDLCIRPRLEESFCSNFMCCGQNLSDLHALLQHYEDCHVRFECDNGEMGEPRTLDLNHHRPSDIMHNAGVSPHGGRRRRMLAVELEQCDFLTDDTYVVSAFDNTVLRTITPSETNTYAGASLKRSQSVPATINYSRLPNLPGQPTEPPADHYQFIHSILSATVDAPDSLGGSPAHTQYQQHSSRPYFSGPSYSLAAPSAREMPFRSATPNMSFAHDDGSRSDKPYVCSVPNCKKSYKNPNGLKYHEQHGHDPATENVERPHRCGVAGCGKRYKNPNGLKYHMNHAHPNFVRHLSASGQRFTPYQSLSSGSSSVFSSQSASASASSEVLRKHEL